MEKIDLNNYEAYFLDFMEGTLSAEEKHDLFVFLEKNPALKAEMEELDVAFELEPTAVVFDNKAALKIDESKIIISANTVEDYMVASIEGQLSAAHQEQLDSYIKANGLHETYAYFKATRLTADTSIVFEEKKKLKVATGVVISMGFVARVASIAAVGIILITVAMNWNDTTEVINGVDQNNAKFSEAVPANIQSPDFKQLNAPENNTINPWISPTNEIASSNPLPENSINEMEDPNEVIPDLIVQEIIQPMDSIRTLDGENPTDPNRLVEDFPNNEDDVAVLDNQVNENPIAPRTPIKTEQPYKILTDAASNVINTDISFKRDKDVDSKEYVAYSFKLGKFEFERKKGSKL